MRTRPAFLAFALGMTLLAGAARAQYNTMSCSNQTISGTYVVTCNGFVTPAPNTPVVPLTILGVVVADANGVFEGSATNSIGGTVFPQIVAGQANTQPNCTGAITYNKGKPDELNVSYVIVANGDEMRGMVTDKGANVSCTLKRIQR